jgi:hypothetical protein
MTDFIPWLTHSKVGWTQQIPMKFQPFLKEKSFSSFHKIMGFCFLIMLDDTYDKQFLIFQTLILTFYYKD